MSACTRVFAVAELQEGILLHLPLNELLRNLRVCRTWAKSTRRIRKALYLEPTERLVELQDKYWKFPGGGMANPADDIEQRLFAEGHREKREADPLIENMQVREFADQKFCAAGEKQSSGVKATDFSVILGPDRGPVLNPFVNIFLNIFLDGQRYRNKNIYDRGCCMQVFYDKEFDDGRNFRSLGIATSTRRFRSDSDSVWKLAGSKEAFQHKDASWRSMQIMQPATTEIVSDCPTVQVDYDNGERILSGWGPNEKGVRCLKKIKACDAQMRVTNSSGVTLGQFADMCHGHHLTCRFCKYKTTCRRNSGIEDFLGDWTFFGSGATRRLRPDIAGGKESYAAAKDDGVDQLVVPGSGFTARHVLLNIEISLGIRVVE